MRGDETVLLDVARGQYYTLSEVGGRIWCLLGDRPTVSTIVDAIENEYAVPADAPQGDVSRDVIALVSALIDHRLVVLEPVPAVEAHTRLSGHDTGG